MSEQNILSTEQQDVKDSRLEAELVEAKLATDAVQILPKISKKKEKFPRPNILDQYP